MPVKMDACGRRWVEVEFVVPGTQEQVWKAVATADGIRAWFAKTLLEEKVGGALSFDMGGGMVSKGVVNAWEPPYRLVYEEPEWMEGAPTCSTEILVAERKDGNCVFHMTHTLIWPDEKFDDMLEMFEQGWYAFVEVLRLYLGKFPAGAKAEILGLAAAHPAGQAAAWKLLTEALGFGNAGYGDSRLAPAGTVRFAGTVERVLQTAKSREMLIRLDEPAGVALIGTYSWQDMHRVSLNIYRYGDRAAAQAAQDDEGFKAFFEKLFPAPAEEGAEPAGAS